MNLVAADVKLMQHWAKKIRACQRTLGSMNGAPASGPASGATIPPSCRAGGRRSKTRSSPSSCRTILVRRFSSRRLLQFTGSKREVPFRRNLSLRARPATSSTESIEVRGKPAVNHPKSRPRLETAVKVDLREALRQSRWFTD